MTEGKEKKRKSASAAAAAASAAEIQRVQNFTAGEALRHARTEKKLGLEEVSAAIHIKVAHLRAIEEGNIEALPGMTYALGYVRSYANYLKLNNAEIVTKFKSQHGAMKPPMPELHIPEPIAENRMPDPMIIGVTAFGAVLLLLLWTVFSGGDDDAADIASAIPPAPSIETVSVIAPLSATPVIPLAPEAPVPAPGSPAEAPVVAAGAPAVASGVLPASPVPAEAAPAGLAEVPDVVPKPRPDALAAQELTQAPLQEEIVIKRGKGRVVLEAQQRSWIQVKNAKQKVIFEKVLKPGEQFYAPDETGLTLITSNAGGIDVYVDGAKAQAIGRTGEIVRGISLSPESLKRKRVRVNQY